MMKSLATYIMRGQIQASLLATVFAVLSLMLPPFSYVSGGIVALVTLRKGGQSGLVVAAIAGAAMAALSVVMLGNVLPAVIFVLVVWLPVWVLAQVLRKTISLSLTLAVAGLLSLAAVMAIHLVLGDPIAWWEQVLDKVLAGTLEEVPDLYSSLGTLSQLMTAIMASAFLLSMVIALFLGRWLQALLYNPGGFGKEFNALRLDKAGALLGLILAVWALVGGGVGSMAADMVIVVVTLYAMPGLALLHYWSDKTGANALWLLGLYVVLLFLPHIAVLLAIAGFADAWLDMRRFIQTKQ